MGELEGIKEIIEHAAEEERAFQTRQLDIQERLVHKRVRSRKADEEKMMFLEVESRLRVDPTLNYTDVLCEVEARALQDSD